MGRIKMFYVAAAVIVLFTAAAFAAFGEESADVRNRELLARYGWEVSKKSVESARVNIPEPFDRVYENYNKIQLAAGLDLRPYAGKKAVRYTYEILNFPYDEPKDVRANVICVGGKPVAGDIMTTAADGFMAGLDFLENVKE